MAADGGGPAQTAWVKEGEDVEREEAGEHVGRVEMLEGNSLVEPTLHEVELTALALREDDVEESLPLRVRPQVKL